MAMSVVYTNFDGVVAETRDGEGRYYVPDTLGSTQALVDMEGNVTDAYDYWSYGEEREHVGPSETELTFLGVLGYLRDVLNRLYYVRARHLRPELARWQTVDPLWPVQEEYDYVTQRPIQYVDPYGLSTLVLGGGLIIGGTLLEALILLLSVALIILLVYLLLWRLSRLLSWICGKLRRLEKDVCGDPDGRPSDVSGACQWCDSCLALFYKGIAYKRCADLRTLYSLICYGSIDPAHLRPIYENAFQAGRCATMLMFKCGVTGPLG